jgi:hypothetical protein
VQAQEREAALCRAVEQGHHILLVPYALVSEGVNLQRHVDDIVWYELARNRFALEQASQRAWRLGRALGADGQLRAVNIFFLAYAGSAAHKKLRKLASENGAAQLFAGQHPDGALSAWAGMTRHPIARLSASLSEQQRSLEQAFARRAAELQLQLARGRAWVGMDDTLAERLDAVWQHPIDARDLWGRPLDAALSATEVLHRARLGSRALISFGDRLVRTYTKRTEDRAGEEKEQADQLKLL